MRRTQLSSLSWSRRLSPRAAPAPELGARDAPPLVGRRGPRAPGLTTTLAQTQSHQAVAVEAAAHPLPVWPSLRRLA